MFDQRGDEEHWYALKVFYNRVFEVERLLAQDGVKSYIPLRCVETTVGGRTIRRREPAVSSLMFVRGREQYVLELSKRLKNTMSDLEMNVFMLVTSTGDPGLEYLGEEPSDLRSGDRVRVTEGPFKGAEGYIKRIKGNRRLIVSIEGVVAVATTYIPGCFLEKIA